MKNENEESTSLVPMNLESDAYYKNIVNTNGFDLAFLIDHQITYDYYSVTIYVSLLSSQLQDPTSNIEEYGNIFSPLITVPKCIPETRLQVSFKLNNVVLDSVMSHTIVTSNNSMYESFLEKISTFEIDDCKLRSDNIINCHDIVFTNTNCINVTNNIVTINEGCTGILDLYGSYGLIIQRSSLL